MSAEFHTYEFSLHPDPPGEKPCRQCEIMSLAEYEEAWTLLNVLGYELHEVVRYKTEPMLGWPKPMPSGDEAERDFRTGGVPGCRPPMLDLLRAGKFPRGGS